MNVFINQFNYFVCLFIADKGIYGVNASTFIWDGVSVKLLDMSKVFDWEDVKQGDGNMSINTELLFIFSKASISSFAIVISWS